MKKHMLFAGLISALTAFSVLSVLPVSAEPEPYPEAPAWLPTDRQTAVGFLNEYGQTHAEDYAVCIVRRLSAGDYSDQEIHDQTRVRKPLGNDDLVYSTLIGCDSYFLFCDEVFTYEIPEDPGENDGSKEYREKYKAYENYQRMVEMYGEEAFKNLPAYEVIAFMPQRVGEFYVELAESRKSYKEETNPNGQVQTFESIEATSNRYSFELSVSGIITETDELAWMPDCETEFEAWKKENGIISVHDDLIVVCEEVNHSTGAELFFGQNGTPCKLFRSNRIRYERELSTVPVGGEGSKTLEVYQATGAGLTQFSLIVARPWDMEHIDAEDIALISADAEGNVTKIKSGCTVCDLNADGQLGIADALLLTKFLTAQMEFNTPQMMLADINNDRKVNAVDLSCLKKLLMLVPAAEG